MIRIGCSGWNYAHWRNDVFYPPRFASKNWLRFYAEHFDTVEINMTFYRLPKVEAVRRWVEESPDGFLFSVKVSRYITHIKRLKDVRAGLEPFRNNALWRLASFSGMVPGCSTCTSYIDTSQPADRASLGPVYRVTYFAGKCCDNAVRQLLYPFAPGGPWAFNTTDVGHDFFLLSHNTGWWHAEGRMGVLFTRFLRHTGIPKSNPVAVSAGEGAAAAEASSATAASSTPWAIPVAIAVMALLLVAGAAAARPRSSGHPA